MKKTYIWNAISYILYALQSPIMLIAISHFCSIEDAGIFSLSFALASLFLCIANFGMRNYQITDLINRFSFAEYKLSRVISYLLCVLAAFIYLMIDSDSNGFTLYKTCIIGAVCIFKFVEAGEDVFHGYYQQNSGLLDAAKILTYRLGTSLVLFFLFTIVTKNLFTSLVIVTFYSYSFAAVTNYFTLRKYKQDRQRLQLSNVKRLMYECLPLCISQILSIYITNASKYAINGLLSDREQAYYGYLSLPIFGIALLSNIIFAPLLTTYAGYWKENKISKFKKEIIKRFFSIVFITIGIMAFGKIIGLQLLSLLYAVDLSEFQIVFQLLLLGGGIMAVCNSLNFAITVIGYHKYIVWAYLGDAVISLILSKYIVKYAGILGASVFMCISFGILLISLTFIFMIGVSKKQKEKNVFVTVGN